MSFTFSRLIDFYLLQADKERDERRRALGGPGYDMHGASPFSPPLSSPSEDASPPSSPGFPQYEVGPESPLTSQGGPEHDITTEEEVVDRDDEHVASLRLRLKEAQYRSVVYEAELTKLKIKVNLNIQIRPIRTIIGIFLLENQKGFI